MIGGLQEEEELRSNSTAPSKETLNMMIAIAANEGFLARVLDLTNCLLLGAPIEKETFVEPPKDLKTAGMIWKLKKTAHNLCDGGNIRISKS